MKYLPLNYQRYKGIHFFFPKHVPFTYKQCIYCCEPDIFNTRSWLILIIQVCLFFKEKLQKYKVIRFHMTIRSEYLNTAKKYVTWILTLICYCCFFLPNSIICTTLTELCSGLCAISFFKEIV